VVADSDNQIQAVQKEAEAVIEANSEEPVENDKTEKGTKEKKTEGSKTPIDNLEKE
jgi:hypothetical protein